MACYIVIGPYVFEHSTSVGVTKEQPFERTKSTTPKSMVEKIVMNR
jgi:hypothetical protein